MPISSKRPEVRRRRKRWLLGVMIAAVVAGLVSWLIPRPPGLPVRARLGGSEGPGSPLAFSPDGSILATGHAGGDIMLWDPMSGKLRTSLRHHQDMSLRAVFSPDAEKLVVLSLDPSARFTTFTIFEVETGRELTRFDVTRSILPRVWFAADGSALNVIQWDNRSSATAPFHFSSWDTETWAQRESRALPLKQQGVIAITKDGLTLAAGSTGAPVVTLWDVASGRQLASMTGVDPSFSAGAWCLDFSQDGATLAVGRADGDLEIWDVATRSLRARLRGHSRDYTPQAVVFGPGRDQVISMGMNWSIPSVPAQIFGFARSLFRPRGTGGGRELPPPEVISWDVASRRPRVKIKGAAWPLLSPDGKTLATTGPGGGITLWDISSESHP